MPVVTRQKSAQIKMHKQSQKDYKKVIQKGADSLTIYQETYHKESYKKYHTYGKKRQFNERIKAPERGARAGFYKINIGSLLGLYDWFY